MRTIHCAIDRWGLLSYLKVLRKDWILACNTSEQLPINSGLIKRRHSCKFLRGDERTSRQSALKLTVSMQIHPRVDNISFVFSLVLSTELWEDILLSPKSMHFFANSSTRAVVHVVQHRTRLNTYQRQVMLDWQCSA